MTTPLEELTLERPMQEGQTLEVPLLESHPNGDSTGDIEIAGSENLNENDVPVSNNEWTTKRDGVIPAKRSSASKKPKAIPEKATNPMWEIRFLPTDQIGPNPFQPRQEFSEEELEELAASVAEQGVQTPVLVRTAKTRLQEQAPIQSSGEKATKRRKSAKQLLNNRSELEATSQSTAVSVGQTEATTPPLLFELVTGERRLRASKKAGLAFIPAILRDDLSEAQSAELALVENVQRSNLGIIEEGRGYKRLMLLFRYTEARIAKKIGKSVASIQAAIKLLDLPEAVQTMLLKRQLTAAHGHELLKLAAYPDICHTVALKAFTEKITAAALAQSPLPNAQQLKRRGLIVELGFNTKFPWRTECQNCPFKAFVTSPYGAYCLKPTEWRAKQDHAIEMEKQEAARILEEARKEGDATLDASDLPPGSYYNLSRQEPPAGCSSHCTCRGQIVDPADASKSIPICLNPARFRELQQEQRKALQEQRERYLDQVTWVSFARLANVSEEDAEFSMIDPMAEATSASEANSKVPSDEVDMATHAEIVGTGTVTAEFATLARPAAKAESFQTLDLHKVAPLLVLPVLAGSHGNYYGDRNWETMVEETAVQLGIELPLDDIMGQIDDGGPLHLLERVDPWSLLLLGAAVLLRQETRHAARWASQTPRLDFVLGRTPAHQSEMEMDESEEATDTTDAEVTNAKLTSEDNQSPFDHEVEEGEENDEQKYDEETDESIIAMLESEKEESENIEDEDFESMRQS